MAGRIFGPSFLPAVSPKALTAIRRAIRRWALHTRSDKSLEDLARMYNPKIRGWITYYSHFYIGAASDAQADRRLVIRWARRKYKRMVHQTKGAGTGSTGCAEQRRGSSPTGRFVWQRPNIGSRVSREAHARFWEQPGVRSSPRDLPCVPNTPKAMEVWSCVRDEGGPLGIGDQEPVSNHRELLS